MTNEIAKTILSQMGGISRLRLFTGATFLGLENGVVIQLKRDPNGEGYEKVDYVKITLNALDYYDMEFQIDKDEEIEVVNKFDNVCFEDLVSIFEEHSGLYLSF